MVPDQFRDELATNAYGGMVAKAYDAYLPPGYDFGDDDVHADVIRGCGGTALELGVGNGRFLVPRLAEGLQVEGIDSSEDILDRCRHNLAERGLDTVLHHGDMAPLALGRTYDAICCTAGSFTLVTNPDRVREGLASYLTHLRPGGRLAISMFVPGPEDDTSWCWRLRRTGTDAEGVTYITHEATSVDSDAQTQHAYNRLEVLDASGRISQSLIYKYELRWWTQSQMAELIAEAGFTDVEAVGTTDRWVTIACRPG